MSAATSALPAGIRVLTPRVRCCVKGRGAPAALEAAGIAVPPRPNAWTRDASATWCLRLGAGEFLLANDSDAGAIEPLQRRPDDPSGKTFVLPRADRCIELLGPRASARLLEVCDIDERRFAQQPDALALVLLADVPVALHAVPDGFRIWCDPTFSAHLVEAFAAIDARSSSTRPAP